jgi:serine/threonine-protein kinase
MNTGERLRRALEVFEAVADLESEARAAKLGDLCAGDVDLLARVDAMLAADAESGDPFEGRAARWSETLQVAGSEAMLGRTFGAWRIVSVAGRGGMGVVYEVERADGAYAQRAALKLLHTGEQPAVFRERFLRERQVLARLRHSHIATLLDGGLTEAGDPWFVMEYVDGVPIDRWCDTRGLGLRARVELFLEVLEAVSYAHRNLLVHRDLKPSNLMVDASGRIKLLDFGIAKQLQDPDLTAVADRAVTFGFASPEQLHDAPITTATDVWQLGVVLQLLLTGSHPFRLLRDTPLAAQIRLLEGEPEPLTSSALRASVIQVSARGMEDPAALAKKLRGDLEAIVAACLRRDPASRYASVDALADDLRRWLENRPALASRSGAVERTALWLRRNRLLAASIAAVSLALCVGTALSLWQARAARLESARSRESLQFLADTLTAAAPEQALNTEVSVRQLLDSARRQLEERSAVDPQVRQPVQRMLGRLYYSIGEFKLAVQLLEAGQRDVEPGDRASALALADDLVVYSDALGSLERNPESLAASERAAALRMRFAPHDPEQQLRAQAHQTLGHVHKSGWEACRQRAEAALAMARRMPDPPVDVVMRLYSDLGSVANFTNDRSRLLQVSEEGLAFADRHAIPPESPLRFTLLRNRIEGLLLAGRAPEAETLSRAVIGMAEKSGGVGATRLSVLYNALSMSLRDQGRYRESLQALARVDELMPIDSSGPRNIATMRANLARVNALVGDYPRSLELLRQSAEALDRAGVADDDSFRLGREISYAQVLLASGRRAEARTRLDRALAKVGEVLGKDSEDYALLLAERVELARQERDAARGLRLLAEVRERSMRRGVAADARQAVRFLRYDAAFARMRGDLVIAEDRQREALRNVLLSGNPFEIAVARGELADIVAARGRSAEARSLLALALPVMRQSVLPTQTDLGAAEALAGRLGL